MRFLVRAVIALALVLLPLPGIGSVAQARSIDSTPPPLPQPLTVRSANSRWVVVITYWNGPHAVYRTGGRQPVWTFSCNVGNQDRFVISDDGNTVAVVPASPTYIQYFHADGSDTYRSADSLTPWRERVPRPTSWMQTVTNDGTSLTICTTAGHRWTFLLKDGSQLQHDAPTTSVFTLIHEWFTENAGIIARLTLLVLFWLIVAAALRFWRWRRGWRSPRARFAAGVTPPERQERPRHIIVRLTLAVLRTSRRRRCLSRKRFATIRDRAAPEAWRRPHR